MEDKLSTTALWDSMEEPPEIPPDPEALLDEAIEEAGRWISEVTYRELSHPKDLQKSLSNGILLCELMTAFKRGSIRRVNRYTSKENIQAFFKACKEELGLTSSQLFSIDDLQSTSRRLSWAPTTPKSDREKLKSIVTTIYWVAEAASQLPSYSGPKLDVFAFESVIFGIYTPREKVIENPTTSESSDFVNSQDFSTNDRDSVFDDYNFLNLPDKIEYKEPAWKKALKALKVEDDEAPVKPVRGQIVETTPEYRNGGSEQADSGVESHGSDRTTWRRNSSDDVDQSVNRQPSAVRLRRMDRKLGRHGPATEAKPHTRSMSMPERNVGVLRQDAVDSNHNSATYEYMYEEDTDPWRSSLNSWKMKRNQVASDVLSRKALREEVEEKEKAKGRRKPKTFREIVEEKQRREKILAKKLKRKKDMEKEEIHAILTSVDLVDSESSSEEEEEEQITSQQEPEQYSAQTETIPEMRIRASTLPATSKGRPPANPPRSQSPTPTSPHKPSPITATTTAPTASRPHQKAPPSVAPKPKFRPTAGAFQPYRRSQSLKEGADFTDKAETDTRILSPSPTTTTPSEESFPARSFHEKLLRDREREKELTEQAKVGQEKARRPTQKRMSMGILGRVAAFQSGEAFKKRNEEEEEVESSKSVRSRDSTSSQESRAFTEVHITMNKRPRSQGGFGFDVTGGIDKKKPIVVKSIEPGNTADRCNLKIGDEIIIINKEKTRLFDHDDIQYSISQAVLSGTLNLTVRRYEDTESSSSSQQLKSSPPSSSSYQGPERFVISAAPPPTQLSPLRRDEPVGESEENDDDTGDQSQARNTLYRAKKLLDALDRDEISSDDLHPSRQAYFDGETGETGYCDIKSGQSESWTESDVGSKQPAPHQASLESTEPPTSVLSPSPSQSPPRSISPSPITSPSPPPSLPLSDGPPPDDPTRLPDKADDLLADRRDSGRISDGLDEAHPIRDVLNDTFGTEDSFFASEGTRDEDLTSTEEERLEEEIMERLEKEEKLEREREAMHRKIEDDERDKSPVKEQLIDPSLTKTEESAPPPTSFSASLKNSKPVQFRSIKGPRPFVPMNKGPEPFRPQPTPSVIVRESEIRDRVKKDRSDFFTEDDSPRSDQNVEELWKQVEQKSLDASTPENEESIGGVQRRFKPRNNVNPANRRSFNLEEERQRLEKWQKEQERILQEQYAQEQRRLKEEQERELQRAQDEVKRKQEMEMKALEERKRMLQKKAEEELRRKEEERLERERIARERKERERLIREEEERRLREEEERLRLEREEEERLERERREKEAEERRKQDELMFARKKQEEERIAREKEKQRLKEERDERERKARERIQREREEYEQLLKERELEKERLALEQAEKQRLAREREEKSRVQQPFVNTETIRPRVEQQQESAPPPRQMQAKQASPPQTQLDIERIREEERERIRMEERERLRREWEELEKEKKERQRKEEEYLEKLRAEQAELQRERQRLEQQHKEEKERLAKEKEKIYSSSKSLDEVFDDDEKTNTYNRKNKQLSEDDIIDKRMVPERDVKPGQVFMSKYKDESMPTEQHWLVEEAKRRQQGGGSLEFISKTTDLMPVQPRKDSLDHEPVLERKVYSEQQSAPTPNIYNTKPYEKDYRKSEPPGYEQEIPTRIPPPHRDRDQGSPTREKQPETNRWDAPRHKYETQPEFRHVQRRIHGQPDPERKRKMQNRRSMPNLDDGQSFTAPVSRIKEDPGVRRPSGPPGGSMKSGGGPPPGGMRTAPPPAGPGGDMRRNGPAPDALIQPANQRRGPKSPPTQMRGGGPPPQMRGGGGPPAHPPPGQQGRGPAPRSAFQQPSKNPPPGRSVSGKMQCSNCNKSLGRGAAMIIESLGLHFHLECFRCCVCNIQLGNGTHGTDVRIRASKLHCQNCYSNDAGFEFTKV